MDTLDFFRRVLPPKGWYCTVVINKSLPPQQLFFGTLEELAINCLRLDTGKNNTYYALSSFKVRGNRKQVNAGLTKALFLDIDCAPEKVNQVDKAGNPIEDKGYLNQQDGLAALIKFLAVTKLPNPMIVSSGRGLHIYWVLDEALSPDEWQPLADALKSTFKANGFFFDPSVTADRARVLRPIGTHNPKNGAEVKLLLDGPTYSKQTLQNVLGSVSPGARTNLFPPSSSSALRVTSSVAANMAVTSNSPPASAEIIYHKCAQVAWAVNNQAKVSEPMWYALMGIAAYCKDADSVAQSWSKGHPGYNPAQVTAKMKQWKMQTTGPTTCNRFQDERSRGCAKCPVKGVVVSPAQLGTERPRVERSDDVPDTVDKDLSLPKPFRLVEGGIVQRIDGTDIEVCPFELYPVGYGRDEHLGYETVRYVWKRQHVGWSDLVFRQAHLNFESREFATTIADQGIVLKGKKQTEGFQYMLRAYMDELRKKQSMSNIYGSMGWKENHTQFVIGERLYKRKDDGSVSVETVALSSVTGAQGKTHYTQKGTIAEWVKLSSVWETADMPWHIFALNSAFSAPLWEFTGLKGITISLCGHTGGGKSVIQLMMQSIWGDPGRLHVSANTTHNALFNRLGVYGNLPLTIDEATHMKDVGDFCFWVTQGRDKSRLTRNAVERVPREWATNVTVSTNVSFASKMAADGIEIDAQMARLLEVDIPIHKLFMKSSNAGRSIVEILSRNHGIIGDALIKEFLRLGEANLRQRIKDATAGFASWYGCTFVGTERFWETKFILDHVACTIAQEAELIGYDFRIGIQYLVDRIEDMRTTIADTHTTSFTLIKEYLNENAADVLTVMHTVNMHSAVDQARLPRGEIKARFDVYRKGPMDKFDRGTVMIVRKGFRTWLASNGYDYSRLCKELVTVGADATPATKRCVLSRDTGLKAGQHYVVGINLNNIEMLGFLDNIQQSSDDLTLGRLEST